MISSGDNIKRRQIGLLASEALFCSKHSKSFNLSDTLAVGVDGIQGNFGPMNSVAALSTPAFAGRINDVPIMGVFRIA